MLNLEKPLQAHTKHPLCLDRFKLSLSTALHINLDEDTSTYVLDTFK